MPVMRILDSSGDTALAFAPDEEQSLTEMRAIFDELVGNEKRLAFARRADETEAVLVRAFDPEAEEIVITKPLVGG